MKLSAKKITWWVILVLMIIISIDLFFMTTRSSYSVDYSRLKSITGHVYSVKIIRTTRTNIEGVSFNVENYAEPVEYTSIEPHYSQVKSILVIGKEVSMLVMENEGLLGGAKLWELTTNQTKVVTLGEKLLFNKYSKSFFELMIANIVLIIFIFGMIYKSVLL